jgi:hypothetical protein
MLYESSTLVATAGSKYRPVLQARDRDPLHQYQVNQQTTRDDTLRMITTPDTFFMDCLLIWIEKNMQQTLVAEKSYPRHLDINNQTYKITRENDENLPVMTSNIRWTIRKSRSEGFGILPSIPGYVRYAADKIKMEGVITVRLWPLLHGICRKQQTIQGLQVFFPRGFFLYIVS